MILFFILFILFLIFLATSYFNIFRNNAQPKPEAIQAQKEIAEKCSKLEATLSTVTKERDQYKKIIASSQTNKIESDLKNAKEEIIKKDAMLQQLMDEGGKLAQEAINHQNETMKVKSEKQELFQKIKELKQSVKNVQEVCYYSPFLIPIFNKILLISNLGE